MKLQLLRMICFGFVLSNVASGQIQCGGTERWRPKVGTDPEVSQVEANQPTAIELHDLLQLPEPVRPDDNVHRVVPQEVHVYTVRAFMLKFKEESNDSDYHIVITDDTHQFTDTHGNHIGHSIIAEIPDPSCLAGKNHQFPGASSFADQITATRQLMDHRFPHARKDGSFNDVSLPVEITAVGFFDRSHGQIGRAPNNLELHPILRLCFLDGAQPDCSSEAPTNLGQPVPLPAGAIQSTASAPFSWSLTVHAASANPIASIDVAVQGTGITKLRLNFYSSGAVPSDSLDSTSQTAVKNLDRALLSAIVAALQSAGTLTMNTASSGHPPKVQHELVFGPRTP